MRIFIEKEKLTNFDSSTSLEWLETNGLGGWSSGTVSGVLSRRYHGLLVPALNPPLGRFVMLSKFSEQFFYNGKVYELDTNQFPDYRGPHGYQYLTEYYQDPFPTFIYNLDGVILRKTVGCPFEKNTVVINYEVLNSTSECKMQIRPFLAFRDYHSVGTKNDIFNKDCSFDGNLFEIKPYDYLPKLSIQLPEAKFNCSPEWFERFEYAKEIFRGQDANEDLLSPGYFEFTIPIGDKFSIIASVEEEIKNKNGFEILEVEKERRLRLNETLLFKDDFSQILNQAADKFIVKRGDNLKTILAGYHWFSDWGRDTMISLPGLCLVTGRFDDAKKIIRAFADNVDKGLIPNRFSDRDEINEYNTVDATLWYFVAIYKYYLYTKDADFIKELFPILEEIIAYHRNGTRYKIKVDKNDGFLSAGEEGVQLTWMDAKYGDWVVTPRYGKAVEINALWYNALEIMSFFSEFLKAKDVYTPQAQELKKNFEAKFIIKEGYLADYIDTEGVPNIQFRPNQVIALSMPFECVSKKTALFILNKVEKELLIPYGLRSLSKYDPEYIGYYGGDTKSRDGAYHQGTAWSWLIGSYYSAKVRYQAEQGKSDVLEHIEHFKKHLLEFGVGSIAEIFDGDEPNKSRGCVAQAWGVAEVLRAYIEDVKR